MSQKLVVSTSVLEQTNSMAPNFLWYLDYSSDKGQIVKNSHFLHVDRIRTGLISLNDERPCYYYDVCLFYLFIFITHLFRWTPSHKFSFRRRPRSVTCWKILQIIKRKQKRTNKQKVQKKSSGELFVFVQNLQSWPLIFEHTFFYTWCTSRFRMSAASVLLEFLRQDLPWFEFLVIFDFFCTIV